MKTTRTGTYKEIMEKTTKIENHITISKNNKETLQKDKTNQTANRGKEV